MHIRFDFWKLSIESCSFCYKTEIKRNIVSNQASLKQFVKIIKFSRFPIKRSIKNINGCIEPCDHVFLKRLKCFVALFHLVFTKRKAIISFRPRSHKNCNSTGNSFMIEDEICLFCQFTPYTTTLIQYFTHIGSNMSFSSMM